MSILRTIALYCLTVGLFSVAANAQDRLALDEALIQRSLVSAGDSSRLHRAMSKARTGQPIAIGVIGGSITEGAKASRPENRYPDLVADWWRNAFPKCHVDLVNAGVGATGSNYGCLRVQRDLLARKPDVVIVEFAVNDGASPVFGQTYEGLLRQILSAPGSPAAILLFMMNNTGHNQQAAQARIGEHYGLPMVSYRDALWPEIEAKHITWQDISRDIVHPNDRGHALAARFIINLLEKARSALPPDHALPPIPPLPAPLLDDLYAHTAYFAGDSLKPSGNSGWLYEKSAWRSDRPGSVIEFDIEGRNIYLVYFRIRKDMGKAQVTVDDARPKIINGWFDQTWGGYCEILTAATNLVPGSHHLRIELLEEKNPESNGHEFRILGLGAAGTAQTGTGH
jgi:lysophospholipase L1-like esterase